MKERFSTSGVAMLMIGCALLAIGLASRNWVVLESGTASARGYFSCSDCEPTSLRSIPNKSGYGDDKTEEKVTFTAVLGWGAGLLGLIVLALGFVVGTQMVGGDAWAESLPAIAASALGGLTCFALFAVAAPRGEALGVGAFGYMAGCLCVLVGYSSLRRTSRTSAPDPSATKLTSTGEKRGSKRHGEWRTMRADGTLARLEVYDYGEITSWIEYDENGAVTRCSDVRPQDGAPATAATNEPE